MESDDNDFSYGGELLSVDFGFGESNSNSCTKVDQFLIMILRDSCDDACIEEDDTANHQMIPLMFTCPMYDISHLVLDAFIITMENLDTLCMGDYLTPTQKLKLKELCSKCATRMACPQNPSSRLEAHLQPRIDASAR